MPGRVSSPTLATLWLFLLAFVVQSVAGFLGLAGPLFVLAVPLSVHPWTLVTSVYAHGGLVHLAANAIALVIPGFVLERKTTPPRFHAFFVGSGAVAGASQVLFGRVVGDPTGVLGASGAIFALFGYLLTGNRLADAAVAGVRLGTRTQLLIFGLLAVAITVATGAPGVALVAHFTGLLVGLVAGRLHLLRPGRGGQAPRVA